MKLLLLLVFTATCFTAAFAINGSPHSAADHNGMIWARNDAEMTESSWKGKNEQPLNDVLSGKP